MSAGAVAGALVAARVETATANTYIDLGGLRTKGITINNESIDTTNSDSTGRWTELLAAIAARSVEISGDGVFKDGAASDRLRTVSLASPPTVKMEFFIPTFGTFAGTFFVSSLEFGADHSAEVTYSASFTSTGEVTFTNIS